MDARLRELKFKIGDNKTESVLKILIERTQAKQYKEISNEVIVISAKFMNAKENFQKGSFPFNEFTLEVNNVNHNILRIIDEIASIDKNLKKQDLFSKEDPVGNENKPRANIYYHTNAFIELQEVNISDTIVYHLNEIKNWAKNTKFRELNKAKSTVNIYVDLDYYLTPLRMQLSESTKEENEVITLNSLLSTCDNHIVILGQPGAGKTTTVKKIILSILDKKMEFDKYEYPILIRLRDLNNCIDSDKESKIYSTILNSIGLDFSFNKNDYLEKNEVGETFARNSSFVKKHIINLIDSKKLLIIFDGFDEISTDLKQYFLLQIKDLILNLNISRIILTARTGEFNRDIDNSTAYEIKSLSDQQIRQFISQWLENQSMAENLYNQIRVSPFSDTMIRPLTLANLCAIFEKYKRIPDKPKSVYRRIVNLLLEEWDLQRDITRGSRYSGFEVDRKSDFLSHLAYILTTNYKSSTFDYSMLSSAYEKICSNYNLPANEKNHVIDELENHSGLFLQSGYDKFEFAHKSIQEFLTADYLVKLPNLPFADIIIQLPSEIAIAISISSNSSQYFSEMIFNCFKTLLSFENFSSFFDSFINRLIIESPDFQNDIIISLSMIYIQVHLLKLNKDSMIFMDKVLKLPRVKASFIELLKYYKHIEELHYYRISKSESIFRFYNIERDDAVNIFYYKPLQEGLNLITLQKSDTLKIYDNINAPDFIILNKNVLSV